MKKRQTHQTLLGGDRGFKRESLDFYPTNAKLVRALIATETFIGPLWEPACGDGAISELLHPITAYRVYSTDIKVYDYGKKQDFLTAKKLLAPTIITNPPFNLWQHFAVKALDLGATHVALLGRLLLLEGKKNSELFKQTKLTRVRVVGRAKMLPPGAIDKGFGGTVAFAWYIFDRRGPQVRKYAGPVVDWIFP